MLCITRQYQWSFRGGTRGNAVPIVKIPLERMGTAFPLLSYGENAWERCCIVTKLPNTVPLRHKHITIYFLKCILLSKRCFLDPKIWQNALAAGAPPRTPLGELTTLTQTP